MIQNYIKHPSTNTQTTTNDNFNYSYRNQVNNANTLLINIYLLLFDK